MSRSTGAQMLSSLGLRTQLVLWVTGILLVSFAVLFGVVYTDTGSQLRGRVDRDARASATSLLQALAPVATRGNSPALRQAASAYMSSQPYAANATLLFVLLPDGREVSNHEDLFAATAEHGEPAHEQSQENHLARRLLTPRVGYSTLRLPDVGSVRLYESALYGQAGQTIVGAGVPLSVIESAQHGVGHVFLLFGVLVLILAVIASALVGAYISRPLRRVAQVAQRIDAGELAPRIGRLTGSSEILVLAHTLDSMLDRLEEAFSHQREFVADASHELRTPLTVVRGQLEVLAAQGEPTAQDVRRVESLVLAEVDRMSRLVEDLLLLAQSGRLDFLRVREFDLRDFVTDLWEGVVATADRRFELAEVPAGTLDADPDRLAQALRNLVRNAISHTVAGTGLVRLEVTAQAGGRVSLRVSDDGPGVPPDERERVFERFHRLDAGRARSEGGSGLGLAIVRAIARAHGGDARVEPQSPRGGARFEIILPGFHPVRAVADGKQRAPSLIAPAP